MTQTLLIEAIERFGDVLTYALSTAAHVRRPLSDVADELASRPMVGESTQLVFEVIAKAAKESKRQRGFATIKF